MALTRLQSVLVLIFIAVWPVLGELTNLGDSFKFATNETCSDGDMKLIRVLKTTEVDRFVPVATLVDGLWTPEEVYKDLIVHQSASSLIFRSVRFNDAGLYEFTCHGNRIDGIQLKVIIPSDVSVTEGQSVKLLCYYFTAGMSITKITWTLNGSLVLEMDLSTGRTRRGSGFNRASVAPDWDLTGDLSLTLEPVQLEDQGEFICHIMEEEEEKRGSPGPVWLTVHKNDAHQNINSEPPKECPTLGAPEESTMGPVTIISVILNVILVIVIFILWFRFRRPATLGERRDGQGTQEETVNMGDVDGHQDNGQPIGPNSNGGGCSRLH